VDSPVPIKQQKTAALSKILYSRVATTKTTATHQQDSSGKDDSERASSSGPQSQDEPLTEIKGVIFDMDGTLTLPVLDFKGIRDSLGLTPGTDILPTVQKYSPEERDKAMAIIEEYEEDGLRKLQVSLTI
jgi:hypothetical protein